MQATEDNLRVLCDLSPCTQATSASPASRSDAGSCLPGIPQVNKNTGPLIALPTLCLPSRASAQSQHESIAKAVEDEPPTLRTTPPSPPPGPAPNQGPALQGRRATPICPYGPSHPSPVPPPPPLLPRLLISFQVRSRRSRTTAWLQLAKTPRYPQPSRFLQALWVSSALLPLPDSSRPHPSHRPEFSPAASTQGTRIAPTDCTACRHPGESRGRRVQLCWHSIGKGWKRMSCPREGISRPSAEPGAAGMARGSGPPAQVLRSRTHDVLVRKKGRCESPRTSQDPAGPEK